jgi:hypothetical protein
MRRFERALDAPNESGEWFSAQSSRGTDGPS